MSSDWALLPKLGRSSRTRQEGHPSSEGPPGSWGSLTGREHDNSHKLLELLDSPLLGCATGQTLASCIRSCSSDNEITLALMVTYFLHA